MNRKLLEYVYRKYGRELYLYLYSLCKEHTLAEELVQETFAKAILSLSDEHPNFRAWLYKVGKNLYQNYQKKWRREEQYQELPEIPYEAGILRLKEGHVRMLLTRARRKLKERLEEES